MAATSVNFLAVVLKELGWSYTRLIAELRRHAGVALPKTESMVTLVSRWVNSHQQPDDFYRDLLSRATDPAPGSRPAEPGRRHQRGGRGRRVGQPHRRARPGRPGGRRLMRRTHPVTAGATPTRLGPGDLLAALGGLDRARAAVVYATLGFSVVPMHTARQADTCSFGDLACSDPGKPPRLRGWKRLASTDPTVVGEWWRRWPDANLALASGRRFDVLDLDGQQGVEALRAVLSITPAEHPGPVARTGGGGWHLLYATATAGVGP
jgi:Bifunctional DNA primase/polymerase, N-terminal